MTSLTRTPHGVASGRRHGRSRAASPYQSRSACTRPSVIDSVIDAFPRRDIRYRVATMRPVGSSPPSMPRSLLALFAVGLGALTAYVLVLAGHKQPHAGRHSAGASGGPPSQVTSTAVPCVPSVLRVAATTDARQYHLGQLPELAIQVTNTGETPCRANLSDGEVELLLYNR